MRHCLIFLISLLAFSSGKSQFPDLSFFEGPPRSTFNNDFVALPDTGWSYNFFTGGHLYGAHANKKTLYPSASFLGNLSRINGRKPSLFVGTGDIMRTSRDSLTRVTLSRVLADLDAPFYNAPGNHDLTDFKAYEKSFGKPQLAFYLRNDLFIILNTEPLLSDGPEFVYGFVEEQKTKAEKRMRPTNNVFVFSHRMPWTVVEEKFSWMDGLANAPIAGKVPVADAERVVEGVTSIPREGDLWWFAGDVGTHWSVPALYAYWEEKDCHFAAAGIGDHGRDALLQVTVKPEGTVSVKPFTLTGEPLPPLEELGQTHWEKERSTTKAGKEKEPGRLQLLLKKRSLWLGLILGGLLGLLLGWLLRGRMKKSAKQ